MMEAVEGRYLWLSGPETQGLNKKTTLVITDG